MPDGQQVLARLVQLRASATADPDDLTTSLVAAVFAEALRTDLTPRAVLDGLWTTAPADDAWRDRGRDILADAVAELEP